MKKFTLLAAAMLLLASCGGGGDPSTTSQPASQDTTSDSSDIPSSEPSSSSQQPSSSEIPSSPSSEPGSSSMPSSSSEPSSSSQPSSSSESSSSASSSADPGKLTGIRLTQKTFNLEIGQTATATVWFTPETAINKNVTFASSNAGIFTVSAEGLITAVGVGTATLTVTSEDGGFTDTGTVTVTGEMATGLKLVVPEDFIDISSGTEAPEYRVLTGRTYQFSYEVEPEGTGHGAISYRAYVSWNEEYDISADVIIDNNGLLTAKGVRSGIMVEVSDGNLYDRVEINLVAESFYYETYLTEVATSEASLELEKVNITQVVGTSTMKTASTDTTTVNTAKFYTDNVSITQKAATDNDDDTTTNSLIYVGIYDGKYYHLDRTKLSEEVSDDQYRYTHADEEEVTDDYIAKTNLYYYSSTVSGLYGALEEVFNSTYYLGNLGSDPKSFKFTENGNTYSIEASFVHGNSSGWISSQYFYDIDFSMTVGEDGMITAISATGDQYNSTGYDFTNEVLKEGATPYISSSFSLVATTGTKAAITEAEKLIDPSECFFTSFDLEAYTGSSSSATPLTSFTVGDTINIRPVNFMPKTATVMIDSLIATMPEGDATFSNHSSATQISADGEGSSLITVSSEKNPSISNTITLSSAYLAPTSIDLASYSSATTTYKAPYSNRILKVGDTVDYLTASIEPYGSRPDYTLAIKEEGSTVASLEKNASDDRGDTYKLTALAAGTFTLVLETVATPTVTKEVKLFVYEKEITTAEEASTAIEGHTFVYEEEDYYSESVTRYEISFTNGKAMVTNATDSENPTQLGSFEYTFNGLDLVATDGSIIGFTGVDVSVNADGYSVDAYLNTGNYSTSIGSSYYPATFVRVD